jgi:hypothetical protein
VSFSVSDVARRLNVRPRVISDLFYHRVVPDDACPVVGGRRLIPGGMLPVIEAAVGRRGRRAAVNNQPQEGQSWS